MKSIQIFWCTEDIVWKADMMGIKLTEEQSNAILDNVEHYHDASIGVNWDVIATHIDMYMDKLNDK